MNVNYSLYISNLAESMTEVQLLSHFSKFGFLTHFKMGQLENGKCKGYAQISTKDLDAYRMILNSEHYFNGREARVEPFIHDKNQTIRREKDIVNKRICVLAVPKGKSDEEFKHVFEIFGEVENAYIRDVERTKKNHGFVTFTSKKSCQKALKKRYLNVNGWGKMQIREFKSKNLEKEKKKNQNNLFMKKKDKKGLASAEFFPFKIKKNLPPFEDTVNYDFMAENHLKVYLKKILESNPQIKNIEKKYIKRLELFFYNKKQRYEQKTLHNYNMIVYFPSIKIQHNHSNNNIKLSKGNRPHLDFYCNFNQSAKSWFDERFEKARF